MSGDSRKREGPDPSRYLRSRSRSIDTTLSQPTTPENVITEQPTQAKVRPRSGYHLEGRPARSGDDLDNEWEILDTVDSRSTEDSSVNKVPVSQRSDSISSATALEEALSENKQLREKYDKLLRKLGEYENRIKRLQKELEEKNEEVMHVRIEPAVSHGPSSDLSSGSYQTPLSSLSQCTEVQQEDPPRSEGPNVLLQLQKDNEAKKQQIVKLSQEVTQLKRRLDHAGGLEEQATRLTMEVSSHEEEKRRLQEQIEQLQRGVQPQPSHHGEASVYKLQQECTTLRQENGELQNQLKITKQRENQHHEENAQLKKRLLAAERKLHSSPVTYIDGAETDETRRLKEALQEKESQIKHLQKQQESYQKTASEFGALQEHSKEQSKQVMQLRSHVDAVKIGETERAEYEQSLLDSLHSLEEQYDKLMKDYQAVSGDRGFMEENLIALKKRNEELVSRLQQCEATMEDLKQKEESARLQWESMRDSHRALHQKNQELFTEKLKLEEENRLFIDNVKKISNLGNENAELERSIIAMRKEKEDLWNELQAVKAESQFFKEDFDREREDRAKAHAQIDDIRTEFTTKVEAARTELQLHKERLTEVEAVNKRKEGELKSALEEALAARQEVQAKTSQVKQYKKQVDSLKAQVSETEKQHTNLIQEMERVRNELVKFKGKAEKVEKAHKKKPATEKVPGSASSPVAPPPPGWESKVAELENINEELRAENDKLRDDNENLQKMVADLKGFVDQPLADRAHVPPHDFPLRAKSDMMQPSALSPTGATSGDQFGMQRALQRPHPLPVAGYGQDQQQIRQQLQQGFQHQQQPRTEEHTAGAGGLTSLSAGPTSLPESMHQQPPPRARIPPPSQPQASRSSEVAPYSDQNPAISPTSHPHHNWPPSSGAGNLPLQQPGAKAFTDPHMITAHHSAKEQFHSAYPATDSNPTIPPQNLAHQRHIQPHPPSDQRQRSGSGSSPQGQQQQQPYIARADPLMQHIDTDIHNVVAQVSEGRTHQATMQHIPYDPNLVCAYCNKQFRMGEIQKYKHHVGICHGSGETTV